MISQLPDPPEGMVGWNPFLDRDIGEQGATSLLLTSHHDDGGCSIFAEVVGFFSELLMAFSKSLSALVALTATFALSASAQAQVSTCKFGPNPLAPDGVPLCEQPGLELDIF